jgi:hypothetical protein
VSSKSGARLRHCYFTAANEAIARYGIDNPNEQARLAAQRVKEIG